MVLKSQCYVGNWLSFAFSFQRSCDERAQHFAISIDNFVVVALFWVEFGGKGQFGENEL